MKHLARKIFSGVFLLSVTLISPGAIADTALSFTGGSSYTWPGASIGWEFSISEEITVTHLGVFDSGSDGLAESHEVGIFPAGVNSVIVSTTVTTADMLEDGFRYASISPTVLSPGSYVVAARMPTGADLGVSFADEVTAPGISYTKEWYLYSANFELPTDDWDADGGNFGANFKFNELVPAPVPAMTQSAMLVLALILAFVGFVYFRRVSLP